jgi:peroxiredoxin
VEAVHLTASVGSGDSARKGLFLPFLAALLGCVLASGSAASQPAATGQLECKVTENGGPASGTVTLLREGQEAYRGNCNQAAAVPPGSYTAVIGLDGVLDGPEKRSEVSVKAGGKVSVAADFATGIIEVQIESKGRQAAGMAVISRDGRQIGRRSEAFPSRRARKRFSRRRLSRPHFMNADRFSKTHPGPARTGPGRTRPASFLAIACLVAACGGSKAASGQPIGATGDTPEPSAVRLNLETPDGETIEIEALRGKRVLLFFFTTYDIASQVEMERLVSFASRHPEIEVVGVALQPNAATLLALYRDYLEIPFPVTHDPSGRLQEGLSDLGLIGTVPSYVLLDEAGRVIGRHAGATTAEVIGSLIRGDRRAAATE